MEDEPQQVASEIRLHFSSYWQVYSLAHGMRSELCNEELKALPCHPFSYNQRPQPLP